MNRSRYNNNNRNNRNNRRFNQDNNQDYNKKYDENNNTRYNNPQGVTNEVKEHVLRFIYKEIDISKFKYKLLEFKENCNILDDTKYVSPNYNGVNSILVFTKVKDNFYSFTIDRRTLHYSYRNINISDVKMFSVNIRLDESIYRGTIIDGVLLYNNPNRGSKRKIFMINDVYIFRGENLVEDNIKYKMFNLNEYFKCYHKKDDYVNNIELVVNSLYEFKNIELLQYNHIPASKYKNSIKGLAFFPEKSLTKIIYLYSNGHDIKNNIKPQIKNVPSVKKVITNSSIIATFRIKNIDIPDVYNLYLAEKIQKNGKKCIKYIKHGIAFIQTIECSHFCKQIFEHAESDTLLVNCNYVPDKDKWVPFQVNNEKKLPDSSSEIINTIGNP